MNPLKLLVDLIIPRKCHICGEKLGQGEDFICLPCETELPRTAFHNYWKNTTGPNTDLNPMEERFAGQIPLVRATSLFFYTRDSAPAQLVHDFKYRGFPNLAEKLGTLAARELSPTGFFDGIDCICPIPLHRLKHHRRGYNQTEMIAQGVSKVTDIPLSTSLKAVKGHKTQTSLSREERIANTKDVFGVRNPELLEGKTILIIDDICTTGATILSAAHAIEKACPSARFSILTLGFAGMS